MDRIIESGTYTARRVHPHNGYYAGDFSTVPFKQPDLRALSHVSGSVSAARTSGAVVPRSRMTRSA